MYLLAGWYCAHCNAQYCYIESRDNLQDAPPMGPFSQSYGILLPLC